MDVRMIDQNGRFVRLLPQTLDVQRSKTFGTSSANAARTTESLQA